ncbi:hypothetical protein C4K68_07780 [Pokkaliibacter plantistimulans]|uniref:Uncharacterized protein n=1 Tax=Proteobacteria bacterium 228 TaxID=2083153 RepID=A0A2S5KSV4_9PROT|nr:hypothetical protein [Pokkaliibacter plantistimulans]PPC77937.1 hypothetical protein C4K68_07780 [Pokkaliibacter plantistimulans]
MSEGLLIAGQSYITRLDQTDQGAIGPIDLSKFGITTATEKKNRLSKRAENYGAVLDSVIVQGETTVAIEFNNQPADLMALVLKGIVERVNTGSGTVSDEAVTIYPNGRWAKLAQTNIAGEGITLTLASDNSEVPVGSYEIDYSLGMIRAIAGGTLDSTTAIATKLSYQHNAISGKRITGGKVASIRARIDLVGVNLVNNNPVKLTIPEVVLTSEGEIDFLNSDYVSGALTGTIKSVSGKLFDFQEEGA